MKVGPDNVNLGGQSGPPASQKPTGNGGPTLSRGFCGGQGAVLTSKIKIADVWPTLCVKRFWTSGRPGAAGHARAHPSVPKCAQVSPSMPGHTREHPDIPRSKISYLQVSSRKSLHFGGPNGPLPPQNPRRSPLRTLSRNADLMPK
jgi:hypothetical protein